MTGRDESMWSIGFHGVILGKRKPDGVLERLRYESGYVEGAAEGQEPEAEGPK